MAGKIISQTRALVVDDNAMSRAVIGGCLSRDGYIVVTAISGDEAISAINSEPIDIIFLDLLMDGMSGMETLATIKESPKHKNVPVVVVSGVEDEKTIAEVKAAGAVDFMNKPVGAKILRQAMTDILGVPLVSGLTSKPHLDADVVSGQPPIFESGPIEQLKEDYGHDTAFGFIAQFENLAPVQKDEIAKARNEGNIKALNRYAHDLKSGSITMGLLNMADLCRNIEVACNNGKIDDANNACDVLNLHFDDSMKELRKYASQMYKTLK